MSRTLLLGLDGATRTLLDPLFEQGVMPFLKSFVEGGVSATLRSTACPVTPPAWTSIITGRNPGVHGIFDFLRVEHNELGYVPFRLANARDIQCETLWSITGRQGKQTAVLNFPNTYLAEPFNGYMVPGFVTSRLLRTGVHPPEFMDRVKALPDFDLKSASWDIDQNKKSTLMVRLDVDSMREWIAYLKRKERSWAAVVKELIANTDCDIIAVVFEGVDRLQHMVWDLLDPAFAPDTPTDDERAVQEESLAYYRLLDSLLAEVVEAAGPDTRSIVVSDHGFGSTTEVFHLNVWLEKEGYLVWKPGARAGEDEEMTPRNMRDQFDSFDWSGTVAYARTASANGIYICDDTHPGHEGLSGEDYHRLRNEIREKLLAWKDPATGTPVVVAAMERETAFPGPAMNEAPDLTLTLRDGGFISITKQDEILRPRPEVKGTHRPEGIFFANGAGFRKGVEVPELSVLDVTPTLLYSVGLPVPEDMEGVVAEQAFEPSVLRASPVEKGPPTRGPGHGAPVGEGEALSDEDENAVLQRLKALGYLS